MSHYGYLRTIQWYNDLGKHYHEFQRHLDRLNGDGSWMGVRLLSFRCTLLTTSQSAFQARTEAAINAVKVRPL
jgi:ubiquitin conjugation factor E4 B